VNAKQGSNNVPQAPAQTLPSVAGPTLAASTNAYTYSKTSPAKPSTTQAPPASLQPPPLPLPQAPVILKAPNSTLPPVPTNTLNSVLQHTKQAFSAASQPPQPPSKSQYGQALGDPPACLIPGCGKPVHVDENGMPASDYCSQRHRERAVNSGMVSPCIMCLSLPQGDADHFCSRLCREEALSKPT